MNKPLIAHITFGLDAEPEEFHFHTISGNNPWRLIANDIAVELVPVCDSCAQAVPQPPLCDRLEIWPVSWGYPDSLIEDQPEEVEAMRKDHYAGMHDLIDVNLTWKAWLQEAGLADLWRHHRTPEMEKHWLNWDNVISSRSKAFSLPGQSERTGSSTVKAAVLKKIHFRADFFVGETFRTVYLEQCIRNPLTTEERKISPTRIAQDEKRLRREAELKATETANIMARQRVVDREAGLEAVKKQNRKAEAQIARERANRPVTRADCCETLGVGDRQLRKICKHFGLGVPETQRQLDVLLTKHQRHKKAIAERLKERNKVPKTSGADGPDLTKSEF